MDYHKLQGFVYDKLINTTEFSNIHDSKSYKLFCFSNIFPLHIVKAGEIRNFIFASPNHKLIEAVFNTIKSAIESKNCIVNIGEQLYELVSAEIIQMIINSNIYRLQTSTPLTMRIPENKHSDYYIPLQIRKRKFLYWRSNLPTEVLLNLIKNNILKKYRSFYNLADDRRLLLLYPFIDEFSLLNEIIIHIPVDTSVLKIPASYWKIQFEIINKDQRKLLEFAIDVGLGERNSMGLGFVNMEEGGFYKSLAKSNSNSII